MPEVTIDKGITLDLLSDSKPGTSVTSDMPVIETHPDAVQKKPEKKEVAAPVEGKTKTAEPAPADKPADATAADDAPKPAKGVQKRIDELTRQREEANRRAEANEELLRRTLAILEAKGQPAAQAQPAQQQTDEQEPQRPQKAQFADQPEAYENALDDFHARRSAWLVRREVAANLAEERRRSVEAAVAHAQEQVRASYAERVERAREKFPDYSDVAESPDVRVSIPMAHAIMQSPQGPEIAYHLGKNPAEAKRIASLSPPVQLLELGMIAARLAAPAAAPAAPSPSKAPAPAKPLTPSTEASASSDEESMETYAARRKAELREERRPGARR
jgi:hypothetical protein